MKAHTLFKLGRCNKAITALTAACRLAEPNGITLPFLVIADDMRSLASAALQDSNCQIPQPWLEDVLHKTSAYAKLKTRMVSAYMAANHIEENPLSKKETAFLVYMDTGLTQPEIAAVQNASVSAVKRVVYGIYDKLCVSGPEEALRIAKERGFIL